jgi:hypothetical protein
MANTHASSDYSQVGRKRKRGANDSGEESNEQRDEEMSGNGDEEAAASEDDVAAPAPKKLRTVCLKCKKTPKDTDRTHAVRRSVESCILAGV